MAALKMYPSSADQISSRNDHRAPSRDREAHSNTCNTCFTSILLCAWPRRRKTHRRRWNFSLHKSAVHVPPLLSGREIINDRLIPFATVTKTALAYRNLIIVHHASVILRHHLIHVIRQPPVVALKLLHRPHDRHALLLHLLHKILRR